MPSPPPLKKRKVESTTTKSAVHSFFTPTSKKEPEKVSWHIVQETVFLARYRPLSREKDELPSPEKQIKIAAFDLDSTIIQTLSGNIFPKDATDWQWWHPTVPGSLKKLHEDGFTICILTNQGNLGRKHDTKTLKAEQKNLINFKTKVGVILNHFNFPILLLAATARDQFRKPRTGMWGELLEELGVARNDDLDIKSCVFVGDAGGRAARGALKADHSSSDRDLASNIGIDFKTPEEFFLHEERVPFTRIFEPSIFLNRTSSVSTDATPIAFQKTASLDIVVMCGSPGSGKSTFYWSKLRPLGYERVNQDTLKTREKCVKVADSLLAEKKSIAVDNTNADPDTRAVWVRLAKKHNVPVRCVHFTAPAKLCAHNDTVRALAGNGDFNPENRTMLPHAAFTGFASRFKEPKTKEGFEDIVRVEFEFNGDDQQRQIWGLYWI